MSERDALIELRPITANEARAYIEDKWREKLNEIYDGVRVAILTKKTAYTFDTSDVGVFSKELVLHQLEKDGYRLCQAAWDANHYTIFW